MIKPVANTQLITDINGRVKCGCGKPAYWVKVRRGQGVAYYCHDDCPERDSYHTQGETGIEIYAGPMIAEKTPKEGER